MPATAQSSIAPATPSAVRSDRLMSVDALRGFDMFWIIGADELVHGLYKLQDQSTWAERASGQLTHKDWSGFAFYDLIFPLFIFLVGVSLVFSLSRLLEAEGRTAALWKIFQRFAILFLLGIFYSGGLTEPWPEERLMGVLQRIAICYLFAALLFCFCRPHALFAIGFILLVGYWALLSFVPIPGLAEPSFAENQNLANHLDEQWLPGKKYYGRYDPEGLLSSLPAIATCLIGVLTGIFLRKWNYLPQKKSLILAMAGVGLLLLGFVWGIQFPIIKKIWTSSYVLVAGGYSLLLLAAFHQVIDVWKWRRWAMPFVWIGMNAITLYLAYNMIDFRTLALRLAGGDVSAALSPYNQLAVGLIAIGFGFLLARFLYHRKIFLKV